MKAGLAGLIAGVAASMAMAAAAHAQAKVGGMGRPSGGDPAAARPARRSAGRDDES